jgi:germination protein M
MSRSEDHDSLEERFERNAPPVDSQEDWMEVRTRMLEHGRRPTRRWVRATTISFAMVVLVAAVVVGGIEAFNHLGGHGQTVILGGDPTTISTAAVTSTASTAQSPGSSTTQAAGSSATAAGSSTTAAAGTVTISVYFTRAEKMAAAHRVIPKTLETGKAAVLALLEGPTAKESAAGLVGAIPQGTRLLGLTIKNGVATVNLSKEYESGGGSLSMFMRIAQVVYTLTQFPTVSKVSFQLEGKPVTALGGEGIILDHPMGRADYEDMAPAILVESPAVGDTVSSPLHVSGSANTFEATFMADLLDANGHVIAQKQVMATSGTGTRGTFAVDIPFSVGQRGNGTLKVFELSAKDGSPINVVEIPLKLEK